MSVRPMRALIGGRSLSDAGLYWEGRAGQNFIQSMTHRRSWRRSGVKAGGTLSPFAHHRTEAAGPLRPSLARFERT